MILKIFHFILKKRLKIIIFFDLSKNNHRCLVLKSRNVVTGGQMLGGSTFGKGYNLKCLHNILVQS